MLHSSTIYLHNYMGYLFPKTLKKYVIFAQEAYLYTTEKTHIKYFIVGCGPGSHSIKVSVWPRPNNDIHMLSCLGHAQMCLWCTYIKHICLFSHFSRISNTVRPPRSERQLHFEQSEPSDVYKHVG